MTVVSFLRTTKYPPSLMFVLMTMGPALLMMAWLDRLRLRPNHPLVVIGRVPMFYYVLHFWVAHVLASLAAAVQYGSASLGFLFSPLPSMGGSRALFPPGFGYPLWTTYLAWIAVVLMMYPSAVGTRRSRRGVPTGGSAICKRTIDDGVICRNCNSDVACGIAFARGAVDREGGA